MNFSTAALLLATIPSAIAQGVSFSPTSTTVAETVEFIDGGVGTCMTAEGQPTTLLYVDCRDNNPYSMKDPEKFPPFVTGTDETSFCQLLCAQRSECVGFTFSDWYSGGCQLHALHAFSPKLQDQSLDLMSLNWGQANMCSRKFDYISTGNRCTDNCVITQSDGIQGRNYHCYYKTNQGGSNPTSAPTNYPTTSPTNYPTTSPTNTLIRLPPSYTLPSPNCTIDVTDGTSVGDVTCTINGIISPEDAIVLMAIKAYGCVSDYNSTLFDDTAVTAKTSQAIGVTTFEAVANVDPSSGYEGEVAFCVRTDLKDATSSETMMYRSEQIKLTFSYDGSFQVKGFQTTKFDGIGQDATTAVKNFGVTATVCDPDGNTLSNPPALSIGTNLFVCLNTDVVGTNIPTITSFIAQKGTETPYIINGSSPNVVVIGLGSSSVKVVMNFPARFFADATDIVLSGSVEVTQDSRRRLTSSRTLVEENENAEFEMIIKMNNNDDGSAASGRFFMISTAIFGVAFMLFI